MGSSQSTDSLQNQLNKYLDKVKQDEPPNFICDVQNHTNLPLVAQTLDHTIDRLAQLAQPVELPDQHQANPTTPAVPSKNAPAKEPIEPTPTPAFSTARLPLISEVWNGNDPANYHVQIHVGTKDVPFYVIVDTGSSLLWLQSNIDGSGFIPDQNMFTPSQGGQAHVEAAEDTQIVYGDNRTFHLEMYKDQVNLGNLNTKDQPIGAVVKVEMSESMRKSRTNGLMGLGTSLDGFSEPSRRNLAQTLFAEKKIQFPSFSFVGPRNDPQVARKAITEGTWQHPRGEFVVGALPTEVQDNGGITWCPLRGKDPNRWVIRLNEVVINGETVCKDQFALIDSGTSYIVTSANNFEMVRAKIKGQAMTLGGKADKNLFVFPPENLKTIDFKFGKRGGDDGAPSQERSFSLFNDDLNLGRDSNNLCISSIITLDDFPFDQNVWILGGIFMDNFVVTFDFTDTDRKIGFATLGSNGPLEVPVKA